MKKLIVVIFVFCISLSVTRDCLANDWGYFLGGFVAGIVLDRCSRCNECVQCPSEYDLRPDMPYVQQRCYKKVWIPGSLQLRCEKGYYNFWGNFVPPKCFRVWVPGYWQCQVN